MSTVPPLLLVNGHANGEISAEDPGLLLGLTVFDTYRCYGRCPLRRALHFERLGRSARAMGIDVPDRSLFERECDAVQVSDGQVRYTLTAGGARIARGKPVDQGRIGRPVSVGWHTHDVSGALPGFIKHGSRAAWVLAARRLGVEEVLLLDREGFVLEANRSNVVAVVDGELVFPPDDGRALSGVTRGAMLDAAALGNLPVQVRPLHRAEPMTELYLCSTLKELAPASLPGGPGPGPLGRALHRAFRALVYQECGVEPEGGLVA